MSRLDDMYEQHEHKILKDRLDAVEHPEHYCSHPSGVECIKITEHLNFCIGNAIKYFFRYKLKNGLEDLKKCRWYIDRELQNVTKENWKVFPSDSRYEVSNLGNVRMIGKNNRKPVKIKNGYLTFLVKKDKYILYYVHKAVAESFIGEVPKGMCVCHENGNKLDNSLCNLRIDTYKNNTHDRISHGTHYYGENNPSAKLTLKQVEDIRISAPGISNIELAKIFNVSRSAVQRIRAGISWQEPCNDEEIQEIFEKFNSYNEKEAAEVYLCLWRAGIKNKDTKIEDLRKALWYINREINRLERE